MHHESCVTTPELVAAEPVQEVNMTMYKETNYPNASCSTSAPRVSVGQD